MQFSEELDRAAATAMVSRMDGTRVDNGDAAVDTANRKTLTVGVGTLVPGGYIVQWHAVTPDDNGVTEGSFTFTVVTEGGGVATPVTAPPVPGGTGSISGGSPLCRGPGIQPRPRRSCYRPRPCWGWAWRFAARGWSGEAGRRCYAPLNRRESGGPPGHDKASWVTLHSRDPASGLPGWARRSRCCCSA